MMGISGLGRDRRASSSLASRRSGSAPSSGERRHMGAMVLGSRDEGRGVARYAARLRGSGQGSGERVWSSVVGS